MATIEGPLTGGTHGWAFGASSTDPAAHGYVEEELAFAGSATTYRAVGELGADGEWSVEPDGEVPFRTRMLVRRPVNPADFSGTVFVVWGNVSSGFEMITWDTPEIYERGHAIVGVSAQTVALHGFDVEHPIGLTNWDSARYGRLSIPTDDASYDVFTQAALLVGPDRPTGQADPLGGLRVERMIAEGGSQSAARLHTYVNAVAPLRRVFDGFLLTVHFGAGSPISTGGAGPPTALGAGPGFVSVPSRLRTDLGVPIMVRNTETEALRYFPSRQPDTDDFRLWEAAGTSHVSDSLITTAPKLARDFGVAPEFPIPFGDVGPNTLDTLSLQVAAVDVMHRWVAEGAPPREQPRLELSGEPPALVRDERGNALGGIRLPAVEVPVATLRGDRDDALNMALLGSCIPFDEETVRRLYPTHDDYVTAYRAATEAGVAAGFIPADFAPRLIAEAEAAPVPGPT